MRRRTWGQDGPPGVQAVVTKKDEPAPEAAKQAEGSADLEISGPGTTWVHCPRYRPDTSGAIIPLSTTAGQEVRSFGLANDVWQLELDSKDLVLTAEPTAPHLAEKTPNHTPVSCIFV